MDDLDIDCRTVRFVPIWRTAFTTRHQASKAIVQYIEGFAFISALPGITRRDPVTTDTRCKFLMARSTPLRQRRLSAKPSYKVGAWRFALSEWLPVVPASLAACCSSCLNSSRCS